MGFKYISLDIETTGLDQEKCQVIEFAAVLEDTEKLLPLEELPSISFFIRHPSYYWESYAQEMNKELFAELESAPVGSVWCAEAAAKIFGAFLDRNDIQKAVIAGKNAAGFDIPFLRNMKLPYAKDRNSVFHTKLSHRVLDVGPLFVDWKEDQTVPDLATCLKRAGIDGSVKHRALGDAKQVIQLLRTKYQ
jgi:oligoribonuclease